MSVAIAKKLFTFCPFQAHKVEKIDETYDITLNGKYVVTYIAKNDLDNRLTDNYISIMECGHDYMKAQHDSNWQAIPLATLPKGCSIDKIKYCIKPGVKF